MKHNAPLPLEGLPETSAPQERVQPSFGDTYAAFHRQLDAAHQRGDGVAASDIETMMNRMRYDLHGYTSPDGFEMWKHDVQSATRQTTDEEPITYPYTHARVVAMDLVNFKTLNDKIGHDAGDRVLQTLNDRLGEVFKRQDDVIGRAGGDEVVLVLPTNPEFDESEGGVYVREQIDRVVDTFNQMDDQAMGETLGIPLQQVAMLRRAMPHPARRGGLTFDKKSGPLMLRCTISEAIPLNGVVETSLHDLYAMYDPKEQIHTHHGGRPLKIGAQVINALARVTKGT